MLKHITSAQLLPLLAGEHPHWDPRILGRKAQAMVENLDPRLEAPIAAYLADSSRIPDFRHGEFSLYEIANARPGGSFLTAVKLMDAYMQDPDWGKALIFRR